jgi:arsenate reductase
MTVTKERLPFFDRDNIKTYLPKVLAMKNSFFLLIAVMCCLNLVNAQHNRFNAELDKFCLEAINRFSSISSERKAVLNEIANEMTYKKYVVFTCGTNSRRTLLLQVWAQTAFYYYGLFGKYAFSAGSKVTDVYPGVAGILTEAGFTCNYLKSAQPNGYVISINKDYPMNILSSKSEVGTIDTTIGIVLHICMEGEAEDSSLSYFGAHLPYQTPKTFEQTAEERPKYRELNNQIACEMLYLALRVRTLLLEKELK